LNAGEGVEGVEGEEEAEDRKSGDSEVDTRYRASLLVMGITLSRP
jgi:hypothetical protein